MIKTDEFEFTVTSPSSDSSIQFYNTTGTPIPSSTVTYGPITGGVWIETARVRDELGWTWVQVGVRHSSLSFDTGEAARMDAEQNAVADGGDVYVVCAHAHCVATTHDWIESVRFVWNCDGKLVP